MGTEATCDLPPRGKEGVVVLDSQPRTLLYPLDRVLGVDALAEGDRVERLRSRAAIVGFRLRISYSPFQTNPLNEYGPAPAGAGPVNTPTPSALISVSRGTGQKYGSASRSRKSADGLVRVKEMR